MLTYSLLLVYDDWHHKINIYVKYVNVADMGRYACSPGRAPQRLVSWDVLYLGCRVKCSDRRWSIGGE